jgi:hypothetical protein
LDSLLLGSASAARRSFSLLLADALASCDT